jgi:uncharacterized protein (DUF488 family)
MKLWTVGHSTHAPDAFAALLERHGIETLADVRRVPGSRRHPHFRDEALAAWLPARGVGYRHLPGLGGWRRPSPESPNGAWRNSSFRAYADFALTLDFRDALAELGRIAEASRTAIMCSEALWWRCHRRLVADRLVAMGNVVCHIGADGTASVHELPPFARVQADGAVLYPAGS